MTHSEQIVLVAGTVGDVGAAVAIHDAASALYAEAGIVFDFADDHPMAVYECAAWARRAAGGGLFFAVCDSVRVGFVALGTQDGEAYLEQIAVLPTHMRRGIGTVLMEKTIAWSRQRGSRALWLTTYDHVPWNRAYYERFGFEAVPAENWGADVATVIAFQRRHLPLSDRRIVVCKAI